MEAPTGVDRRADDDELGSALGRDAGDLVAEAPRTRPDDHPPHADSVRARHGGGGLEPLLQRRELAVEVRVRAAARARRRAARRARPARRGRPRAGRRGRARAPSPPARAAARRCCGRRPTRSAARACATGAAVPACRDASTSSEQLVRDGGENHVGLDEQQALHVESALVVEEPPPAADDDLGEDDEDVLAARPSARGGRRAADRRCRDTAPPAPRAARRAILGLPLAANLGRLGLVEGEVDGARVRQADGLAPSSRRASRRRWRRRRRCARRAAGRRGSRRPSARPR